MATKHLITGNELSKEEINHLLSLAERFKKGSNRHATLLKGKHIAIVFEKPSTRTRFSFTTAINQLGGQTVESISQTRKLETPRDFIRVIQGYCAAMMIRTFDDTSLFEMREYAKIPIINGLTDTFHPCQTLADLLTLKEYFSKLQGLKIAYIGDGNNILHSLMIMAAKLGIQINYCCPKGHEPNQKVLETVKNKNLVYAFEKPKNAVRGCHAVYTDVWTSMGFEEKNETAFEGYQVNEELMSYARKNAIFMHCMPMNRGKEVSMTLPDSACSAIFQQSQNRMFVQKALLVNLLSRGN